MAERHAELWLEVLYRCRASEVPSSTMQLWIEPGQPLGIEDNRLVVAFPENIFAWTARRYRGLLGEAVRGAAPELAGIRVKKQTKPPPSAAPKGVHDG